MKCFLKNVYQIHLHVIWRTFVKEAESNFYSWNQTLYSEPVYAVGPSKVSLKLIFLLSVGGAFRPQRLCKEDSFFTYLKKAVYKIGDCYEDLEKKWKFIP